MHFAESVIEKTMSIRSISGASAAEWLLSESENSGILGRYQKKHARIFAFPKGTKDTVTELHLDGRIEAVMKNVVKMTDASMCTLFIAVRDQLRIVSHIGHEGLDLNKFSIRIGKGIAGCAAAHGIPIMVADTHDEPRYMEYIPGVRSKMAVPIIGERNILGVLVVDSDRPSAFSLDDLEILMELAGHMAVVLEYVRNISR